MHAHIDDGVDVQRAWYQEIQEGGYRDGRAEYLVRGIQGRQEAAGHLRDQVAPEEGRVEGALHTDRPVELDAIVLALPRAVLHH